MLRRLAAAFLLVVGAALAAAPTPRASGGSISVYLPIVLVGPSSPAFPVPVAPTAAATPSATPMRTPAMAPTASATASPTSTTTGTGTATAAPTTPAVPTPGPSAATIYSVTNTGAWTLNVEHVFSNGYAFWDQVAAGSTTTYHVAAMPQVPGPFNGSLTLVGDQPVRAQIVGYDYAAATPTPI